MQPNIIGFLFILCGLLYGSLVIDAVYDSTLGYLLNHNWIKPPLPKQMPKSVFGRKPTIFFYSIALILIGIAIIWKLE